MNAPSAGDRVVLVVEDDEATAELERRALSRAGWSVRIASRVSDAVGMMKTQSFAAVLLDYHLPDGDPWTVLDAAQSMTPRVPVIIVTAMGNERIAAEALHRGVADYVKKGDEFWERLPSAIHRVSSVSQAEEALRSEREALAEAQQLAHLGSWEWDVASDRVQWSDEVFRIFGLEPASFGASYQAFVERVHPEDRDRATAAVRGTLETGEPFEVEYRIVRGDGAVRVLHARGRGTAAARNDVRRLVGTVQDITEREEAKEQMAATLREKEALLREKEVLLREIHHRVKNHLQVVSSLLNLQARQLVDPVASDVFRTCQTRVQSIALVHDQLYEARDYSRVPFAAYVRRLAGNVLAAAGSTGVSLAFQTDDVLLSVDRAIPCGLITNELVMNAIKHAFGVRQTGTISIELGKVGPEMARLTVSDDGVGLPEAFTIDGATSVGLQLVDALARQIGAKLEIRSGAGASIELTFAPHGG